MTAIFLHTVTNRAALSVHHSRRYVAGANTTAEISYRWGSFTTRSYREPPEIRIEIVVYEEVKPRPRL